MLPLSFVHHTAQPQQRPRGIVLWFSSAALPTPICSSLDLPMQMAQAKPLAATLATAAFVRVKIDMALMAMEREDAHDLSVLFDIITSMFQK